MGGKRPDIVFAIGFALLFGLASGPAGAKPAAIQPTPAGPEHPGPAGDDRTGSLPADPAAADHADATGAELAASVYRAIERWESDPDRLLEARRQTRAAAAAGAPSWQVALNGSLAALVAGYKYGDPYRDAGYMRGTLDRAVALAPEPALDGSAPVVVHAHHALLSLIRGSADAAERHLERAIALDPDAFRPHLYSAVLALRRDRPVRAAAMLDAARARASDPVDLARVERLRIRLARQRGEIERERALHRRRVAQDPGSVRDLVAYADFLARERRLAPARDLYRRALAIRRAPEAVAGLEATELRIELRSRESSSGVLPAAPAP